MNQKKSSDENRGEPEKKQEPQIVKKENTQPSPTHQKKEKVITPENFKKIKQIHPHEEVKIVAPKPQDVAEGEEIKFD